MEGTMEACYLFRSRSLACFEGLRLQSLLSRTTPCACSSEYYLLIGLLQDLLSMVS